MKTFPAVFLCLLLLPCYSYGQDKSPSGGGSAPAKRPEEVKDRYHAVQVDPVTVHEGVQFPSEYLVKLQAEIGKELSRQKEFQEVVGPGQTPAKAGAPTLRLSEEITSYEPGSRAKRYLGVGIGQTVVNARIVFMDGDDGREFMTEDLRAILAGRFFGGSGQGVVQEFARQIVTKTKLMLAKRLPGPDDADRATETSPPAERAGEGEAERHTVDLPGTDWKNAQEKLAQESALGFRVRRTDLKGKDKAEAILEKGNDATEHYEYRLLHTLLPSTLEKEMNRASSDGFRVVKETLAGMGNSISVIMEKGPSGEHYAYRVNQALLISSSQKNTEKNQANGYALVAETEHGAAHVLIFEKMADANK